MKNLLVVLLAAAGGAAIARLGVDPLEWLGARTDLSALGPTTLAALAVAGLLVILAVLAVHELGHALAGRLAGFDFHALIVGPLRCERRGGRLRLGLNRSLALAGGLVVMVPREGANLRTRMAAMTAGGPAASLVLGLALGAWLLAGDADGGTPARSLAGIAAIVSTAIASVTLIPGRTGGFSTDGGRILLLLRGGEAAEREVALLTVVAAGQAGVRPADLDPGPIERLRAGPAGVNRVMGDLIGYAHHLDRGELDAAEVALERARADAGTLPPSVAPSVALEAAYFAAVHRQDARRGRSLLETAGKGALVPPETPLRAEAAVLVAEGRAAEAGPGHRSRLAPGGKLPGRSQQEFAGVGRERLFVVHHGEAETRRTRWAASRASSRELVIFSRSQDWLRMPLARGSLSAPRRRPSAM